MCKFAYTKDILQIQIFMKLIPGLYEQIISELLSKEFQKPDAVNYYIDKEKIDSEESPELLSRYLLEVVKRALNIYKNNIPKQIALTNNLIKYLAKNTETIDLEDFLVQPEAEILFTILNKVNSATALTAKPEIPRPITPMSQSSLFTGTAKEPSFAFELRKEILTSDRIDMLVSFVKWSGIVTIEKELREFCSRPNSSLRVITTSYMKATDLKAVDFLSQLPNTEIKVSFDTNRTRLHAKAYMFHRDTGFTTAYIGSSNLSNPALTSGLEWNLKVTAKDSLHIVQKFEGTFETYWEDSEFVSYNQDQKERLRQALNQEEKSSSGLSFYADVRPYSFQDEILEHLDAERNVHGRFRNLVVAATGTGKTVISAFDYKRYCQNNPKKKNRLLFVAHRKEILEQSLDCFRTILRDRNFGELMVGQYKASTIDHLFISIQSFNAKDFQGFTSADFYDFIIVDEFHHSKAKSYRTLLEYYTPNILLGLTATPERMDGKDVLEYFDGKIAAEIRLYEALDRKLLSPFRYFGVTDVVSYQDAWQNGKYDERMLEGKFLDNKSRNELIIDSIDRYTNDINNLVCIGFCVTVNHANYMADYFNMRGLKATALTAESTDDERSNVRSKLLIGELNFVFVVDIYNEGVDIPEIDTVLFLRPTESLTVFLQQLGRGLRLSPGKECLTVLDFVGLSHRNYSFENKFKALIGKTYHSVLEEAVLDFPHLPAGCEIRLEKQAKEYILDNIKASLRSFRPQLISRIKTFTSDTGKMLSITNFIKHYNLTLNDIYSKGSWNRLLFDAGIISAYKQPDEEQLSKGLRRLQHTNSRRFIKEVLVYLEGTKPNIDPSFLLMLYYNLWFEDSRSTNIYSLDQFSNRLRRNNLFINEMKEMLEYNFAKIDFIDQMLRLPFNCPLDLHCRYTTDEVLTALGVHRLDRKLEFRQGVLYVQQLKTDLLFVTLNKSEKEYSPTTLYDDYAISRTLFHWQSQSTTSLGSPTGQRYINHDKTGNSIFLFVRENKKENGMGAPYHFLGPVHHKKHEGSNPISFIWELENAIPAHLIKETLKLSI